MAEGKVRPERIVAVTFTEAAAAELKERIGAQLLELGRVEDALRLEEAYVSTIHGFGLRLLTEFAFESGSSPQPRLLNEDEQNALIRLSLARTSATDEITENLETYGYKFDWSFEEDAGGRVPGRRADRDRAAAVDGLAFDLAAVRAGRRRSGSRIGTARSVMRRR